MDAREARARLRRAQWTGGVARSFEEMDEVDLEWRLSQPPEERVGCVFEMWAEQARLQDPDDPLVHHVAHSGAILGGFSLSQIDTRKRHDSFLWCREA